MCKYCNPDLDTHERFEFKITNKEGHIDIINAAINIEQDGGSYLTQRWFDERDERAWGCGVILPFKYCPFYGDSLQNN